MSFQFHLVRLKACNPMATAVLAPLFQFHLVRLKALVLFVEFLRFPYFNSI